MSNHSIRPSEGNAVEISLIEGSARLLRQLEGLWPADSDTEKYRAARLAFLEGRTEDLKQVCGRFHDDKSAYSMLARARMAIRSGNADESINDLLGWNPKLQWAEAERLNLLAMLYERREEDGKARDAYRQCYQVSTQCGMLLKAASSYQNMIAAESRIAPTKRLIHEYQYACALAESCGDLGSWGAALNNLSREYQLTGAMTIALATANKAIHITKQASYGSFQFGMALCHRAQLHIEMSQIDLATIDCEEASLIDIPEVREAVKTLRAKISYPIVAEGPTAKSATWTERSGELRMLVKRQTLTEIEEKILDALTSGPQSRDEMLVKIYGEASVSLKGMDTRVNQAIYRLRKKVPNLIVFSDGRYSFIRDL